MCRAHRRAKHLYCRNKECEVEICPACMTINHSNHDVINAFHERKRVLVSGIDNLVEELESYRPHLRCVEREVSDKLEEYETILHSTKEELLKGMANKSYEALTITCKLNAIAESITKDDTINHITDKTQEMENIKSEMAGYMCKPVTYRYFCLMDKEYEVDVTKIMVDIKLGKYIKKGKIVIHIQSLT